MNVARAVAGSSSDGVAIRYALPVLRMTYRRTDGHSVMYYSSPVVAGGTQTAVLL